MFGLGKMLEEICNLVIRPQRFTYHPSVLGPRLFMIGSRIFERKDFEIENSRKMKLKCSHFLPHERQRIAKKLPCVIYLHGNCGSRCDALACINILLQNHITVFAFDFSGSGLSDGDFVSLGYYEKDDVKHIIQYLRSEGRTSRIGLWGRSMGAATAIICSAMEGTSTEISAVIADSSFMSLQDLIVLLVKKYIKGTPKTMIRFGIKQMRRNIKNRAKFDIDRLVPIEYARRSEIPIFIAHSWGDKFISIDHSEKLFEEYGGQKCIMRFEGDHNSERPDVCGRKIVNRLIVSDPAASELQNKIQKRRKRVLSRSLSNLDSEADEEYEGEEDDEDVLIEEGSDEGSDVEDSDDGGGGIEFIDPDEENEDIMIEGRPTTGRRTPSGRKTPSGKGRRVRGGLSSPEASSFEEAFPSSPRGPQMKLPKQIKKEEEVKTALYESLKMRMKTTEDEDEKREIKNRLFSLKIELQKIKKKESEMELTKSLRNKQKLLKQQKEKELEQEKEKQPKKKKKKKKKDEGEEEEEEEEEGEEKEKKSKKKEPDSSSENKKKKKNRKKKRRKKEEAKE